MRRPSFTKKTAEALRVCVNKLLDDRKTAPPQERDSLDRGIKWIEDMLAYREASAGDDASDSPPAGN